MTRYIVITAAVLLLAFAVAPTPAQAGWGHVNSVFRYFGEFWSDGYHSKGDLWNKPTRHAKEFSVYEPYHVEPMMAPEPAMHEQVPTPAKENAHDKSAKQGRSFAR